MPSLWVTRLHVSITAGNVVMTVFGGRPPLQGSVVCGLEGDAKPPPMALDPAGRRFAIVVAVVEFSSVIGPRLAGLGATRMRSS